MSVEEPAGEKPTSAMKRALRRLPLGRFGDRPPVVSVLRLSGVIGRMGLLRGGGLNLEGVERLIARAFSQRGLKAVALAVNSPGGSPVQSALIAKRIRQLADEKKIPVFAFAEDVAASGGYWLLAAGDEIYADDSSIIGSIGVVSAGFGFPELLARHGIERRVHASGARKSMLDPFRAEQPDDVARLKELQTDIHDHFKNHVRARRANKLTGTEDELFAGDIWSGKQALALGLIDGIGDLRSVMREKFGERVKLRPMSERRGLVRRRLGIAGPSTGALAGEIIGAVEDWAAWRRFGL
jgi:signal peptide peptidase SppA